MIILDQQQNSPSTVLHDKVIECHAMEYLQVHSNPP
jgi:hypothetical protein